MVEVQVYYSSLILFVGNYGDSIKLDDFDVIYAVSWPKAIHEGNGTLQLFLTNNANEK